MPGTSTFQRRQCGDLLACHVERLDNPVPGRDNDKARFKDEMCVLQETGKPDVLGSRCCTVLFTVQWA
jgi:hypothetical protein